jgi:hypothetical protein
MLMGTNSAYAVPSFARQTGMACAACHTGFPELTPFGREFKMNGYVISNLKTISDISQNQEDILELNQIPPLSLMFQTSVTSTAKRLPDSGGLPNTLAQNGTVDFPQEASLFFAGRIAAQVGAFIQATYEAASGSFGLDNTDIRYANNLSNENRNFLFGVTLNNNPTVQDVWNSTPAWGFPFEGPDAAPVAAAATQIDGTLGGAVGGASVYFWWNNAFYGEAGVYRSSPQGFENPTTEGNGPLDSSAEGVMKGVAPYWRFAYQAQWNRNSLEFGTYGMHVDFYPGGGTPLSGPTNQFTDVAADAQYQFIGDEHIFTLLSTYIHEDQTLDANFAAGAANATDTLQTFKIVGNYYYRRKYGLSLGYFDTWGSTDALLYTPDPVIGSNNGSPDSDALTAQLSYFPWLNTKFVLQYTAYGKFNGASTDYDGSGRSASDNNTLYILGWFNF